MGRIRSEYSGRFTGGSHSNGWGVSSNGPGDWSRYRYSDDDASGSKPYPDKPASMTKTWRKPSRLNGKDNGYLRNAYSFSNFAFDGYSLPKSSPGFWLSDGELLNKALSLADDRPPVDLPLFLWELRELPRLLKHTGDVLLGRRAPDSDTYLAVSFGWAPLLSDLEKLSVITEAVEGGKDKKPEGQKSDRLEVSLGRDTRQWTSHGGAYNIGTLRLSYRYRHEASCRAWAVGRYDDQFANMLAPDAWGLPLLRKALGQQSVTTLWNMIPWTWLIDYFVNVADYLEAYGGWNARKLKHICIMQRCESKSTMYTTRLSGYSGGISPGYTKTVRWKRSVYLSPKPRLVFFPVFTPGQIANIAALATSSAPRYAR